MAKSLINRKIIIAPAEMCRSRGGLAGAGRTGDSGQMHLLVQQAFRCQRKQGQLDAGGKTTGISNVRSFSDGVPVQFREAINEMPAMLLQCPRRHLSGPALFMIALSFSDGPEVRIERKSVVSGKGGQLRV